MDVRDLDSDEISGLEAERQWVQSLLTGLGSDVVLTKTKSDIS